MTVLRVDTISGIGSDGPVFDGDLEFNSQNFFVLPKGTTTEQFPNFASNAVDAASARGLFMGGGESPGGTLINTIDYITISTLGDSQDFGDLTELARWVTGSVSSSTRGIRAGGFNPSTSPSVPTSNVIDYVTIASTGDAQDFGDLTTATAAHGGCSNSTRGIFAGGNPLLTSTKVNVIQYIAIATLGNSQDFGDLSATTSSLKGLASSVRGVFAGGYTPTVLNSISFVTIASTGNAQDFGDLASTTKADAATFSSSTRGIIAGGNTPSVPTNSTNTIDYITIATMGNSISFGSCSAITSQSAGGTSSTSRGVFSISAPSSFVNTLEYITISTTSDSQDFGDLSSGRLQGGAVSNGHGGLG